jgi:hypothetical protein
VTSSRLMLLLLLLMMMPLLMLLLLRDADTVLHIAQRLLPLLLKPRATGLLPAPNPSAL